MDRGGKDNYTPKWFAPDAISSLPFVVQIKDMDALISIELLSSAVFPNLGYWSLPQPLILQPTPR